MKKTEVLLMAEMLGCPECGCEQWEAEVFADGETWLECVRCGTTMKGTSGDWTVVEE